MLEILAGETSTLSVIQAKEGKKGKRAVLRATKERKSIEKLNSSVSFHES